MIKHTPSPWNLRHTNVTNAKDLTPCKIAGNFQLIHDEYVSNLQCERDADLMRRSPDMYRLLCDIDTFGLLTGEYGIKVKKLLGEINAN